MSVAAERIRDFVNYAHTLRGDEKGEAQVFCDRLFRAFGHDGYKEAGATLEERIKKAAGRGGTSFADLMWKPRLLLEMKKKREVLDHHYPQAFDYWLNAVPNRPRYVVLCNFDTFSIYDFDRQLNDPVDSVTLDELPARYTALNFLFPDERKPIFNNDREAVSRKAADQMAALFRKLTTRPGAPIPRVQAQRFVLQIVIAMFAEDNDLLPAGTMQNIVADCLRGNQSAYDLFGALFRQMNDATPATAGRFAGVRYFNGGLFSVVQPVELNTFELELIGGDNGAATQDWSKVNPAIFGALFQHSMDSAERHAHGAHFTSEADIQRIVAPTITRPWREEIEAATSRKELLDIRRRMSAFRVLDPACGSGNFLYVSFREMARLDVRLMLRLRELVGAAEFEKHALFLTAISPKRFFGIDTDAFGVELAKVTLMIAKKLAFDEATSALKRGKGEFRRGQSELTFNGEDGLPLDNLDENIQCVDALFSEWPAVDAIVGNPPYHSKNKIQGERARSYINDLRDRFPEVDGRADYCVYWLRRAHDHLMPNHRAGLVGTNTIRQNYSREAGLDYIVGKGGTITEAVSSMVWSGEAVVHVSIVNWIKGPHAGKKRLYVQEGNKPDTGWRHSDFDVIGPSLSFAKDVTRAKEIRANITGGCFQGQTHGHRGFLIPESEAQILLIDHPAFRAVLFPFLTADDLVGEIRSKPTRYVIDFQGKDVLEAQAFGDLFLRVQRLVLPDRNKAADKERARNEEAQVDDKRSKVNKHHSNFLRKWWIMSYPREEMIAAIDGLSRYVTCGRVTKRPIFEFVSTNIRPNDACMVFAHEDDYSFGVLQSSVHWAWFVQRCSTLKSDFRYTSNSVFDTFPWPQSPSLSAIKGVAEAAVALRADRRDLQTKHNLTLRELYRSSENPGDHPLKRAQESLDAAVREAYGLRKDDDPLAFLLDVNDDVASREAAGEKVQGPGLPAWINDRSSFVSADCIA